MSSLVEHVLSVPGVWVYVIVGTLVFAEDAMFVGFVIPGETAAVLGGVDASRDHVHLSVMIAVVVAAAIVGDSVGYEVGRVAGARILKAKVLERHQRRLADAQALLVRRGGTAVLLGRSVAFFRAVMPALAGTSRMPYRRFLVFNAAGGIIWGIGFVLLGYLAGDSYKTVEKAVGRGVAVAVAALAVAVLILWLIRRHRSEERYEDAA
jgi:membrane protein DedA with SNARE-associated domain